VIPVGRLSPPALHSTLGCLATHPREARYFVRWMASLHCSDHLHCRQPWLSFALLDYIEDWLRSDFHVFEFGGGGSTIWFSTRVARVVTVEHDPRWCSRIREEFQRVDARNCTLLFRPQDTVVGPWISTSHDGIDYGSRHGGSFRAYATSIEAFPGDSFDLVVVDGRSRPACILHALDRVRPGGMLILDDSDRPRYQSAVSLLDSWPRADFYGIRALSDPNHATVWQRPRR
jgi:SAM-dependent methyltransferase